MKFLVSMESCHLLMSRLSPYDTSVDSGLPAELTYACLAHLVQGVVESYETIVNGSYATNEWCGVY